MGYYYGVLWGIKKSISTFQVLFYKEHSSYSRNLSLGMSYLNRFLIEEKTQNECVGVYSDYYLSSSMKKHLTHQLNEIPEKEAKSTFLHVIRADGPWNSLFHDSIDSIGSRSSSFKLEDAFELISDFNVIITRLSSERIKCIQKEEYKEFYERGISSRHFTSTTILTQEENEKNNTQFVGDDIEDFFEQLEREKLPFSYLHRSTTISCVRTFHLSMLSDQEERKMEANYPSSYKNFKYETRPLKSDQNYVLTTCSRITFTNSNWFSHTNFSVAYWKDDDFLDDFFSAEIIYF